MARRKAMEPRESIAVLLEQQVPSPTVYDSVATVRAVVASLYSGQFRSPSLLVEQMWQNPRLRVAMATRLAGLTGAEVRWHPSAQNRDARAAAKAMERDWRVIAPTATRKQIGKWGLLLGAGFAQPAWTLDPSTKRLVPRLMPWHPYSVDWYEYGQVYRVQPREAPIVEVRSPALTPDDSLTAGWLVHEPFGVRSYREGYLVSAWYAWFGNERGRRDMLRTSEKVGQGIVLLNIPHGADRIAARDFRDGWRNMGSGAAVPCEELEDGRKFDAKPFEWNAANGYNVVDSTLANTAADLVILFLGGNLQTEVKGGGSYAAVLGQAEVRSDYIDDDACTETDTLYRQAFRPWAEINFGDPDNAPLREVVTDPPERDAAAATMSMTLAQALDSLRAHGVDTVQLCERFRLPMALDGRAQVAVPAATDDSAAAQSGASGEQSSAPAKQDGAEEMEPAPLDITPTDVAAIATVDEGRASRGLSPIGGDVGDRWIVEHSAKIRADAAPDIATAAAAETGAQPGEEPAPVEPDPQPDPPEPEAA